MPQQRFSKILIANRGEIAVRIIRACRELQIFSVAVYSTADAHSLHVEVADEAVWIGEPAPADSYLNIDRIVAAAKTCGAQAIHPGYGFLAENPALAEACEQHQLGFIGPSPKTMRAIASKQAARELVAALAVPVIPGSDELVIPGPDLAQRCARLGYPVLLKAAAGGGGLGMRAVAGAEELDAAYAAVAGEARQAFGDDGIILEKYLGRARHIEVQILADKHGKFLHLYERDCSIQRRRQKIVEESPARDLPDTIRQALCDAALTIARHIQYCGAGTVEFLYVPGERQFYFLEMNTRLQVEHGVTEAVTGVDIVQWQIRIAEGAHLSLDQAAVQQRGHAIECRICAENPDRDFIPANGTIRYWKSPTGQRCDSGVRSGDTVAIHYDSLLAKVIAHGSDFTEANRNLKTALAQSAVLGIDTNLGYLRRLVASAVWAQGGLDTAAVAEHHREWVGSVTVQDHDLLLCAALAGIRTRQPEAAWPGQKYTPKHWSVVINGESLEVVERSESESRQELTFDNSVFHCTVFGIAPAGQENLCRIDIEVNHHRFRATCFTTENLAWVHSDTLGSLGMSLGVGHRDLAVAADSDVVSAPMPAKIVALRVKVGAQVSKGEVMLVLESMKMETSVTAPRDATIATVHVREGELVSADVPLITFDTRAQT